MKRNMRKWMYSLAGCAERKAMPILSFPGITLLRNTGVLDVVTDGRRQFESMKALADRYDTAASVSLMDLSVEAEAFGSPVTFSDQEVPSVSGRIIHNMKEAEALAVPDVGTARTGESLRAIRLAVRHIQDRPVLAGVIGPFSLAARLMDMTEIMVASLTEPDLVHAVLEKTTAFLARYMQAYKDTGANGVIMAEPAAGLLSPEMCDEFSSRYMKSLVNAVQDDTFMVILHNCGNALPLVPSMLSTGAMGLHFGNAVNMTDILPMIPWGRVALGNIDPARILRNGTVRQVETATRELLEKTAQYRHFVLSSGCDIPPATPHRNIQAFFDALKDFNGEMSEASQESA